MSEMHMESLDQIIEKTDKAIADLKVGSMEWEKAINATIKLRETKSDLVEKDRAFMEKCERDVEREYEHKLKVEQLEEQKRARKWECGSRCGVEFLKLATYVTGLVVGLCIEKEGLIRFSTNKQSHSNCMRGK